LFSLPGFTNVDVTWSKSDAALIREAKDAFFNRTEVDNLVNITEANQLLSPFADNARTILNKLPLLHLANGYLYYSFGVAPLLKDMKSMAKSWKDISPKMKKYLLRKSETVTGRSYASGKITLNTNGLAFYGLPVSPGGGYTQRFITYKSPRKICTVRGKHKSNYTPDSSLARLDYLATRFLTAGPASFLWEKIPYSFVLDWFVDTSRVINALDNALTGNKKSISDICLSEAWSILVSVHAQARECRFNTSFGDNVANVELSKFARNPVTSDSHLGLSGRFGNKQVALTAALFTQIVTNLTGKRQLTQRIK